MHHFLRSSLISSVCALMTLAGCRAPVDRSKPTADGGLTAVEYSRLKAINDAQSSALETVQKLSDDHTHPCGLSERRNVNPLTSAAWSSHTKVAGSARCPVQFLNEWAYDPLERRLNFRHELKTDRQGPLTYRRATGVVTREGDEHRRTLTGSFHYDRIEIKGLGFVEVEIQTTQKYTKTRGSGELRVTVRQAFWSHVGTMRWRQGRGDKKIYEVDGHSITEEGFNELFSAYGLPEIMANSMKMR